MPNWINGCLKVRGSFENVKKFFTEGLEMYGNPIRNFSDNGIEVDNILPREQWQKENIFYDNEHRPTSMYIDFYGDNSHWAYVKNSKRAFITTETSQIIIDPYSTHGIENDIYIGTAEINQAWGFHRPDWIGISEDYNVDIYLYGLESGMMFSEEIEISEGRIIKYSETQYDSWTIPIPWIGG